MDKNDLLDKLIRGILSEEEKAQVEHLMATDPEFRDLVDFETATKEAMQREKAKELKAYLAEVDLQFESKPASRQVTMRPNLMRYAAIFVAIGALTAVVFWMLNESQPSSSTGTFLSYYEPYPNVVSPITRGEEVSPEDIEKAAFLAYERKDYPLADSLFDQIIAYRGEYVYFYKGIVKFELEQYDSASSYFDNYLYSDGIQLRDQAKWYMALSHLVNGDTVKGKEELIRLRKSSGYKMDEVEQILLKLD